jgi:hypothetical protein
VAPNVLIAGLGAIWPVVRRIEPPLVREMTYSPLG